MNSLKNYILATKILSSILIALTMIFTIINWFFPFSFIHKIINTYQQYDINSFTLTQKFSGFFVNIISTFFIIYFLILTIQLIGHIQNNEFFSLKNIALLKKITKITLMNALYAPINNALMSIISTINKEPGERIIALTFGTSDLVNILFFCLTFLLISIFQKGYELNNEQELTI